MKPNEFTPEWIVKNFLPDYKVRYNKYYSDGRVKSDLHERAFVRYNFPEALQNFVDKLCEKQRKKVADCFEKFPAISLGILEIEQPKIEELC